MITALRLRRALILGAVSAAAVLCSTAPARAAEATCPGTFHILHDDRIGALTLPAGHYTITVLDSASLSCTSASDLFRQFLEDYDGRLRRPWVLDAARSTFTRGARSRTGFRVTRTDTPSGGGSSGRHPVSGTSCPGYFRVLHDDHIGALSVPAGQYRITLLATGRISCARTASLFASFLQDYDGRLPSPWKLDTATATFIASYHVGFRVKEAVGAPTSPTPAGRYPSDGTRCRGFFTVRNNDRIGKLRLAAGRYILTTLRGGGVSCSEAVDQLRRFLDLPLGNLPRPWVLDARNGTFRRGRGSRNGFRVKPGS
jgi:hypothetical protein